MREKTCISISNDKTVELLKQLVEWQLTNGRNEYSWWCDQSDAGNKLWRPIIRGVPVENYSAGTGTGTVGANTGGTDTGTGIFGALFGAHKGYG